MKKEKRKQITLVCCKCKKSYKKDLSEYVRNQRLGRQNYCSLSCTGDINKIPLDKRSKYDISQHSNNQIDKYTKFRFYFKVMGNDNRKDCNITYEELEEVWNNQKGICPYSNISLTLSTHTSKDSLFYRRASIDRIDSSLPYTKDNVEFVSLAINLMKNKYSKKDTLNFIKLIQNQQVEEGMYDIPCS